MFSTMTEAFILLFCLNSSLLCRSSQAGAVTPCTSEQNPSDCVSGLYESLEERFTLHEQCDNNTKQKLKEVRARSLFLNIPPPRKR